MNSYPDILRKKLLQVAFYYRKSLKVNFRQYETAAYSIDRSINYLKNQDKNINIIASPDAFLTNKDFPSFSYWSNLTINEFIFSFLQHPYFYNKLDVELLKFSFGSTYYEFLLRLMNNAKTPSKIDWLFYFPIKYIEIIAEAYEFYNNKALGIISKMLSKDKKSQKEFCKKNNLKNLDTIKSAIEKNIKQRLQMLNNFIRKLKNNEFKIDNNVYMNLVGGHSYHSGNFITNKQKRYIRALNKRLLNTI